VGDIIIGPAQRDDLTDLLFFREVEQKVCKSLPPEMGLRPTKEYEILFLIAPGKEKIVLRSV
jgi:hypothetical protein